VTRARSLRDSYHGGGIASHARGRCAVPINAPAERAFLSIEAVSTCRHFLRQAESDLTPLAINLAVKTKLMPLALSFPTARYAFPGNAGRHHHNRHFLEMQFITNIPSPGIVVACALRQGDFDHAPPRRRLYKGRVSLRRSAGSQHISQTTSKRARPARHPNDPDHVSRNHQREKSNLASTSPGLR
jgi:hypothetical protein